MYPFNLCKNKLYLISLNQYICGARKQKQSDGWVLPNLLIATPLLLDSTFVHVSSKSGDLGVFALNVLISKVVFWTT